MKSLEAILEQNPFLRSLAPGHLTQIVGCTSNVQFNPGEYLVRDGEHANRCYILQQGVVAIEKAVPHRSAVTVQTIGQGDIVGWSWLIPPYRWRFDGRAVEFT